MSEGYEMENPKHRLSQPQFNWKVSFLPDTYMCFETAPNWFWRKMQHIFLGIKWERIEP
jgi:hypothetical protein